MNSVKINASGKGVAGPWKWKALSLSFSEDQGWSARTSRKGAERGADQEGRVILLGGFSHQWAPSSFLNPHLLCPSLLFLHRKLWVPWPRLSSVTALGGSCSLLQRAFLLKGTWCIRRRRGATIHSTCHFPSGQGCQQWNLAVQESRINLSMNDK